MYRAPSTIKTSTMPAASQPSGEAPVEGKPDEGVGSGVTVGTTPPTKGVMVNNGVTGGSEVGIGVEVG
jgi:hypothetical protein